ncbi:hypothetical protein VPHD69_0322 [Vibrio phage D69]
MVVIYNKERVTLVYSYVYICNHVLISLLVYIKTRNKCRNVAKCLNPRPCLTLSCNFFVTFV